MLFDGPAMTKPTVLAAGRLVAGKKKTGIVTDVGMRQEYAGKSQRIVVIHDAGCIVQREKLLTNIGSCLEQETAAIAVINQGAGCREQSQGWGFPGGIVVMADLRRAAVLADAKDDEFDIALVGILTVGAERGDGDGAQQGSSQVRQ